MKFFFTFIIAAIGFLYVAAADAQQAAPLPKYTIPAAGKMQPDRVHSRGYVKPPNLAALKAAKLSMARLPRLQFPSLIVRQHRHSCSHSPQ